jgi:hypothetical protein
MSTLACLIVAAMPALLASPAVGTAAQHAGSVGGHGAIRVQVTDTSINPLPAAITLAALGLGVQLGEDGTALVVDVPDGLYVVRAQHHGYRPESKVLRVTGDTVQIEIALLPEDDRRTAETTLGGRDIARARLRAFIAWSAQLHPGTFVARTEIERRNPRSMSSLLRGTRDIHVARRRDGRTVVHSAKATGPQCANGMLVYVDGVASSPADEPMPNVATARYWRARQPTGAAALAMRSPRAIDINRIDMSSVVAIEVYSAPGSAPPEFQEPGADCGVLSIWTTGA